MFSCGRLTTNDITIKLLLQIWLFSLAIGVLNVFECILLADSLVVTKRSFLLCLQFLSNLGQRNLSKQLAERSWGGRQNEGVTLKACTCRLHVQSAGISGVAVLSRRVEHKRACTARGFLHS